MAKTDQEEEELSPDAQANEEAGLKERRQSAGAQAGKEAEARGVLSEALLSESEVTTKEKRRRSSGKRREAPEVVEKPPAREMGAPEFAELSSLSLLDAHEFAEPEDVNAFLELNLPPGTTLKDLPDNEYRNLLKEKEAFATFVAKRLVRESMDQILSRPVVPDSILERALEMHPETQAHAKAVEEARQEGEELEKSLKAIESARASLQLVFEKLEDAGQRDAVDPGGILLGLGYREMDLMERLEVNETLQGELARQSKESKESLDAKYREEMAALAGRLAEVMEKVAELSPAAIQRDANGRFRLDVGKLSDDAKEQLGVFLAEETNEVLQADRIPEARQKELNLRLLMETDWMQDVALEHIQLAKLSRDITLSWASQKFESYIPRVWSTAVDALQTGSPERQDDPTVLNRFLETEAHLFRSAGYPQGEIHISKFEQEMPSVIPFVIERAKSDADMAEQLFASHRLIDSRFRTIYPGSIWDSAREPMIAQVESIATNFGSKYRNNESFQKLLKHVSSGVFHQSSYDQVERVIRGIAPFINAETKRSLVKRLESEIADRPEYRLFLFGSFDTELRNTPKISKVVRLLRYVDPTNEIVRRIG